MSIFQRIERVRIVPVVVLEQEESAEPLAETLLKAGLDVMEITFRTAAAAAALRRISARLPEMLLGAGTLLEPDQVSRAVDAGARFAVAPGLNEDVLAAARRAGIEMVPGVMTPSEVERALGLGCRTLKFFPAEQAGGVAMLRALGGPYGHTGVRFVPTGGVSPGNMLSYLELPFVVAVGGSWMVEKKLIAAKEWSQIEQLTRAAVTAARRPQANQDPR
jgi:2-dehydro-3-deoxyphosphogluconate aldolase/(4S)-4-hydroxy-2-oxoglutarate aldolase